MRALKDLSVQEFEELVARAVQNALEDALEDFEARRSSEYLSSIEEARADYRAGRTESLDDLLDGD